jgi:hypothetical protein
MTRKNFIKTVLALALLGATATLLAGCHDDHYVYRDYYYITVINDCPWAVVIEPFGVLLSPGDRVDFDIGYDVVHVIAVRAFDGLILAELDMVGGEVLVID